MRWIWTIMMILFLLCMFLVPDKGQAEPDVSADQAVLMDKSSGRVLLDKEAHTKRPVASITKIMTAIIAIESGKMDETVTISKKAAYAEGSSIYLKEGEKIKLKDLVYGLMLRSGNDAAVAIAEHIGGSVEGFRYLMNEKASWLGMTNSHFDNPHGLDSKMHYSTAYDMALLMRYATDNDVFKKITGTTTYQAETKDGTWRNKNKLLTSYYDYCTGGKTGFTKIAGRTLVTTAQKQDMDLIAVTLNAPDDWEDHKGMYEWGFDKYDMRSILDKGRKTYTVEGSGNSTTGFIRHGMRYPVSDEEQDKIQTKTLLRPPDKQEKNKRIGKTVVYLGEKQIGEVSVFNRDEQQANTSLLKTSISVVKQMVGLD